MQNNKSEYPFQDMTRNLLHPEDFIYELEVLYYPDNQGIFEEHQVKA